jgi:hypothetical protein
LDHDDRGKTQPQQQQNNILKKTEMENEICIKQMDTCNKINTYTTHETNEQTNTKQQKNNRDKHKQYQNTKQCKTKQRNTHNKNNKTNMEMGVTKPKHN